jgi:hypothetical protein
MADDFGRFARLPVRRSRWAFPAASALVVGLILGSASPASAGGTSGWAFKRTTGVYWPGWTADTCLKATVWGTHENWGEARSSVTANRCGGAQANMAASWIKGKVTGFRNGTYCNETLTYQNLAGGYLFVGATLCANPPGVDTFRTEMFATVYDQMNTGVWGDLGIGTTTYTTPPA